MNVVWIALRELRATFTTVTGWLVLCGWLFVTGLSWVFLVGLYVETSQSLVYDAYAATRITLADGLFAPFFGNCAVLFVFLMPILAMRTFAEEQARRTLELLLTSPISSHEIVLGKFLGVVATLGVLLAGTLQFPLGLGLYAEVDAGALFAAYVGLLLLGSALGAIGMLASSFTDNQVVAAGVSFVAALALVLVEWGSRTPDDWLAQLAVTTHLASFLQGTIRLSDTVYYLALTGVSLFATHQRLESFRWR